MEIFCAAQDFNFHPHEEDGQIAPINFRKSDGVLLGGDDGSGLALLAAVDHVEDFLLRETVVVGKTLGIDQFSSLTHQAFFETLRLGDAAQRSYFATFDILQAELLAGGDVLKIKRMLDALDK